MQDSVSLHFPHPIMLCTVFIEFNFTSRFAQAFLIGHPLILHSIRYPFLEEISKYSIISSRSFTPCCLVGYIPPLLHPNRSLSFFTPLKLRAQLFSTSTDDFTSGLVLICTKG